ncbi:MAG: DUF3786 domain-containing protein [Armatimonadota bacterium]
MPVESNLLKGYQTAYDMAIERLASADPIEITRRSETEYLSDRSGIRLVYLGHPYLIELPSGSVRKLDSDDEVSLPTRVLLLNYILSANRQRPTGEYMAFREIPGAATYEPSFTKRSVNPLVRTFGDKPDLLLAAGEKMGGHRADVADAGITIPVLPLLPVTYGIWHGDDEFPASGVILFDSSARRMLSGECLVVAASNGVYELMKVARSIDI